MFTATCPILDCRANFEFDIMQSAINMYTQTSCNHIAVSCPNRHSFRLYSTMGWLEDAQKQFPGHRFDIHCHGNAPAELKAAAEIAWDQQSEYDRLGRDLDRFGETGFVI